MREVTGSILRETFGYAQFRGQQQAIVDQVVGGGDALVLMPTGGGKSLCYQIPAIARQRAGHGVTIVVSPLIALMHDQVGALHEAGVDAAFLNSTLDWEQTREAGGKQRTVLLICRSGKRSGDAARVLQAAGFTEVVNVVHGFEGDLNDDFKRSLVNGWRHDGLPWEQM